ncbi:MAG: hypothetical protein JXB15_03865, partial [Anaerolineales bacterium]|nr:hypothetical protein [Anaerolineales bacterium]
PPPPVAIFLPGADSGLADQVQLVAQPVVLALGWRWESRPELLVAEIPADLRLVIALPGAEPDAGGTALAALAVAIPQTPVLAIAIPDLPQLPNLSVIGPQGWRQDQQGFLAGLIAAMITPDWRVGVISVTDTLPGQAARQGFVNGATYFCGLCTSYHGPVVKYPLYVELPSNASSAEWQAAAQLLLDKAVKTVYLAPAVEDPGLLDMLASRGVQLIGGGLPPDDLQAHWVLGLAPDPAAAVARILPELLSGQPAQVEPMPLAFVGVNPVLFSPGRQELAAKILADVLQGYIDTGVDPLTGQPW